MHLGVCRVFIGFDPSPYRYSNLGARAMSSRYSKLKSIVVVVRDAVNTGTGQAPGAGVLSPIEESLTGIDRLIGQQEGALDRALLPVSSSGFF